MKKKTKTKTKETHSNAIGYVLWLFGFTGSHRFYFGYPISGFIYMVTFGLFGVGWLIDLFLIPSMDNHADRTYTAGKYDYDLIWIAQTYLGWLGIHKFLMGKKLEGFLYMFTLGFFLIGWAYDFVTLNEQIDELNKSTNEAPFR